MRQLRKLNDLSGYHLQARDGEIGKLQQVYFDDRRWAVRYLVVQTGNWLIGREVLIAPLAISGVDEESRKIRVDLSRKQIEDSPPVDTQRPVSRHYEQEYYRHYQWEPYWQTDTLLAQTPPIPPAGEEGQPSQPEHPHLRSSSEVDGYRVHSRNNGIGKVKDFILDDQDWAVRYLEIDTGRWLPGKKVLVSPAWIEKVEWAEEEVNVDLPTELIETAPAYDDSQLISREYELALYKHYGKSQKKSD